MIRKMDGLGGEYGNYLTCKPSVFAIWESTISEVKNISTSSLTIRADASWIESSVLSPCCQCVPINSLANSFVSVSSGTKVNLRASSVNLIINSVAISSDISRFRHFFQTTELNSMRVISATYMVAIPAPENSCISSSVPASR